MTTFVVHRNGRPATTAELAPLAFAGYAHFTAMQVREGRVRGLDLHLERLRTASLTMFGRALPSDRMRSYLRAALASGPGDVSLTAVVHAPVGEFGVEDDRDLDVLVRTRAPADGPTGPLALMPVEYERVLPAVKHVGEVAKTFYLRSAVRQGYDDAAFVDREGRLSEATIWNLAFWDGEAVVWPDAAILAGVTMRILHRQLDRMGVPLRIQEVPLASVPSLSGAVVTNSWTPGVPVRRIGETPLPEAAPFVELLHRAYQAEPSVAP